MAIEAKFLKAAIRRRFQVCDSDPKLRCERLIDNTFNLFGHGQARYQDACRHQARLRPAPQREHAAMRVLISLLAALCCSGCFGVPVERVGPKAKEQQPLAGPVVAWSGRGSLSLILPGRLMSLTTYVRHSAGGELRVAMVEDGGLMACDLSYGESGAVVHHCRDELVSLIPVFGAMFHGAYAPAAAEEKMGWRSGRRREANDKWNRWYGGDPVTLGYIHGQTWPVTVGDYRIDNGLLVAHRVHADGPWGAELQLLLDTVTVGEAPPP